MAITITMHGDYHRHAQSHLRTTSYYVYPWAEPADSPLTTWLVGYRVTMAKATAPGAWAAIHETRPAKVIIFNRSLTKTH